jgi:cyclase
VLDDGTRRLELLRVGPAHTRGDAVAYLPAERILFTGDVCVNSTSHNLADPDADLDNWVRALAKLATMDVATVVPGHGALGTAGTLRADGAFIADLLTQVRAGIAKGQSADQIADSADLSRHKPWGTDPARVKGAVKVVYAQLKK